METEEPPQFPNVTSPTLEYAKRTPLAWLSRHRRVLISLTLLLAIGGPTWWYWKPLKHRVLWLYWSRQAANYVMPASGEMSVSDPVRVTALLETNPNYRFLTITVPESTTRPVQNYVVHFPRALARLQALDPRINHVVSSGLSPTPIAFMGTLRRPDGNPRLVILQREDVISQGIDKIPLTVIPPPKWLDPLPTGNFTPRGFVIRGMGNGYWEKLVLGMGNTDRDDPSHLVLPYTIISGNIHSDEQTELEKGTFDVYLRNDDALLFRMRADSTKSIALKLQKETVVSGTALPPAAPGPSIPANQGAK